MRPFGPTVRVMALPHSQKVTILVRPLDKKIYNRKKKYGFVFPNSLIPFYEIKSFKKNIMNVYVVGAIVGSIVIGGMFGCFYCLQRGKPTLNTI